MTLNEPNVPSAEALRKQMLVDEEEAALADVRHCDLVRDKGGWWVVPGSVARHRQHKPSTIRRLVKAGKVVLLRDRTRCALWQGGAS